MSSKKEIDIDYLDRKTKVLLKPKYSDFIEECKKTFYISKSRSELMSIKYNNGNGKEIIINEKNYKNEDSLKVNCWKLIIDEDDDDDNNDGLISLKNDLVEKKKQLIHMINNTKKNVYDIYIKRVKEEIKNKNEEFQKIYNDLKSKYENDIAELEKLKKEAIEKNSKYIIDKFKEGIEGINENEKNELSIQLKDFKQDFDTGINDIKVDEIKKEVKEMGDKATDFINDVNDKIKESKQFKQIFNIKPEDNTLTINNIKEGGKFKLKIKNISNKTLSGNYLLEITLDKKVYKINLGLSGLKPEETQNKEISFKPDINNKGNYNSTLIIKDNDGSMLSNIKTFNINVDEEGLIGDMI